MSLPTTAERVLHRFVALALRLTKPPTAANVALALARPFWPLEAREARSLARSLNGRGSCLSRGLWIAARTRGAELVIGIAEPPKDRLEVKAHAWVEVRGQVISE